jgi:hypothetical protein
MPTFVQRGGGALAALAAVCVLAACEPQVGTKAWCEMMDKKAKGDWTANQAADYAKNCIFSGGK